MDIKEIQNLIKFVSKAGVTEVSLEQGDFKITIKAEGERGEHFYVPQQIPVSIPSQNPVQVSAPQTTETKEVAATETVSSDANLITIKSPMIGTFYRRPSPDKDLFVNVGDQLNKGDVICIIEAMKLFNEIESEISGKVVKILVDDNSPVEYDQPLFLVDPS